MSDSLAGRFDALDCVLLAHRNLWHPAPYRDSAPPWIESHGRLHASVLALDDTQVSALESDDKALQCWLAGHLPDLRGIHSLLQWPEPPHDHRLPEPRWVRDIPGRKVSQISAFLEALTIQPKGEWLEWCAGKGHLGRLMALQHGVSVHSLEWNDVLCRAGSTLAARHGPSVNQRFHVQNVMDEKALAYLGGRRTMALHACGDLHRKLLLSARKHGAAGVAVVPCCHHLTRDEMRVSASGCGALQLSRDDLRLAVTATRTASRREQREQERARLYKEGWRLWAEQAGRHYGQGLRPVPAAWSRGTFEDYAALLSRRESVLLPMAGEAARWLSLAARTLAERKRLSLVRHAFRRALENWLVIDLALATGGAAEVSAFCPTSLTPRNLMIQVSF